MYGRWEGELWFHRRHMWSVPSPSTPSLVAPISSSVFIDSNSFSKDGRKIHVGDCALFQPSHDSPPFVGLIRRLVVRKQDNLSLSVNWLYRPADVKLSKGASPEAAPNEVFYSFHQDEILAASLLHPCKVAFLRKGVELPSRISAFVCRRVYDIETKRLYWLTDKNYINERQEEVDQLLAKTRVEMYGALQAGGHSPKPLNGPNGTTQLKSSADNTQSSSPTPSQVKSKKREHGFHSSDSVKRERLSKADDADSAQLRPESMLKAEIAKITDKGGLVDFEGVEKLIQLMRPESAEKKLDLACRVMLVDVISATDKFDYLTRFVQRRGLHVIDEWLQEVHKGKIGDGSPKSSEKSIDEFLFALLRALDRLPVNLLALQTCNIGKSVNHLRSHKSSEIQKKARSLVDTWKKRVEAEMNVIETRSGTRRGGAWPNKSMMPEVSPTSSRRVSGSSDADAKISTSQPPALRAQQGKPSSGEAIVKSPESPGSTKPAALGTGSSDGPPVTTKEEKSNSASPSAINSQSCSSEHGKTGTSCKEDAPSTSATINKNSGGVSHSRKSSTTHASTVAGVQKEGSLPKFSSVDRSPPVKGTPDTSLSDNSNNQRLIVRLPNMGRNTTCSASEGSLEDASTTVARGSPVVHVEKQDHLDRRAGKGDTPLGNNVVAMSLDVCHGKEGLVGSDDVKKGVSNSTCGEHVRDGETVERLTEASKGTSSTSGCTLKSGKTYEASYSSINALVESCAKISESNATVPVGDDVGMNLLASVAAGEMSTSEDSPENKQPLPEDGHTKMEQATSVGHLPTKTGSRQQVLPAVNHLSVDSKVTTFACEKTGVCDAQLDSSVAGLLQNGLKAADFKPPTLIADTSALLCAKDSTNAGKEGDGALRSHDAATSNNVKTENNDNSASLFSSDKPEDEKKSLLKTSSTCNMVMQKEHKESGLPTTSSGYDALGQEAEKDEDRKIENHAEQSSMKKANMDPDSSARNSEHTQESIDEKKVVVSDELGPSNKSLEADTGNRSEQPTSRADSTISKPVSEMAVKLDFDLNEVLPNDDGIQGDGERTLLPGRFPTVQTPSSSSFLTGNRPASITVAAAAKGPFFPSENLLRGKAELGWKGSAATSAFRPAEPRKFTDVPDNPSKQTRALLDFDLNVGVVDDVNPGGGGGGGGGGLDLNLNACEENPEVGQVSVSFGRPSITQLPPRSLLSGRFSNADPNPSSGFDLNNGPGLEEIGGESLPLARNGMQFMSNVPSVRMSNMDIGNFSSWFPPSGAYPAVVPGRGGEQTYAMVPGAPSSQRMLNPATSFNPEMFRGPVLSSSPAVAYSSAMPFQFPGFPFETNFSLPSNTYPAGSSGGQIVFPTIPSQLVGPSGVVSTPYRPYVMSLPGGSSNVGPPDNRKWGGQGLDLNSGPGGADLESSGFRQLPQMADEQLKMFQQMTGGGGMLKRKEPIDGWDGDRINNHKHPSWQ